MTYQILHNWSVYVQQLIKKLQGVHHHLKGMSGLDMYNLLQDNYEAFVPATWCVASIISSMLTKLNITRANKKKNKKLHNIARKLLT